jgi:LPXTG-motif cell wall-anchored protein
MPPISAARLTFLSALAGFAIIGTLAYFFRRKRRRAAVSHDIYFDATDGRRYGTAYGKISTTGSERSRRRNDKLAVSNGGILCYYMVYNGLIVGQ